MTLGALQMMLREGKRMAEGSRMWRGRERAVRCKVSVRKDGAYQQGEGHRLGSDWAGCRLPVPAADSLNLGRHRNIEDMQQSGVSLRATNTSWSQTSWAYQETSGCFARCTK